MATIYELGNALTNYYIDELKWSKDKNIKCGLNELQNFGFTIGRDESNEIVFSERNILSVGISNTIVNIYKNMELKDGKNTVICCASSAKRIKNLMEKDIETIIESVRELSESIEKYIAENGLKIENAKRKIIELIESEKAKPMENDIVGIIDIHIQDGKELVSYSYISHENKYELVNI